MFRTCYTWTLIFLSTAMFDSLISSDCIRSILATQRTIPRVELSSRSSIFLMADLTYSLYKYQKYTGEHRVDYLTGFL